MEAYSKQYIANVFHQIDKDHDGLISLQDLTNNHQAFMLCEEPTALNAFCCFSNGKMNLKDFTLLIHANHYRLVDLAISKFKAEKYLNKYLSVSAPGEVAPSLKRSYLELKAHKNGGKQSLLHSIGIEFGVDKPHQQKKIKEISLTLGHSLCQAFFLLKFSTPKNGEQIASKLLQLVQTSFQILKGLVPEAEQAISAFKPYAKYHKNFVDNPLIDEIGQFAIEVVQSISPQCAFMFKASLQSNLNNLLTQSFDYTQSTGQASVEFDIDHVTLKKIKSMVADYLLDDGESTPIKTMLLLLAQQVKLTAQFKNLGEAIASTLQIKADEIPKPYSQLEFVKELNLKETLGQLYEGGPDLLQLISNSSHGQGEVSINFHDFFVKVIYDVHIEKAFQLLG